MSLELGHQIRHHLFRMRFTELNEIYWFMAIRSFALSLVTIFVPVYLYKENYGVSNIFLYFAFLYLFEFFFEHIASRYIRIKGPKHSMIFSLPFMILHIWQLFTLGTFQWSPLLLAITLSISLAFFWEGYHYDFSRAKHRAKTSKEVGKIFILLTIIGSTAPLIGGFTANIFGINALLLVVIGLLIVASFMLFRTKDNNFKKGKLDFSKVNIANIDKQIVSYVGLGWETVSAMHIWPLFLFLIVGTYSGIGLITSATLIVSVVVTYWVSQRGDKGKRGEYIKTGSWLSALIGVFQVFVQSVTQAFAVNLGRTFAQSIFKTSFDAEYYLHADEESRSEYICIMESAVDLSRFVFHFIMFLLSLYFALPVVLISGLLLGAVGSVLVSLMPPSNCDICGEIKNKEIKVMRKI